jgi:cardiolipin synthase
MFARDLAESNAIELQQWQNRSILLRLQEWTARLIEYWL